MQTQVTKKEWVAMFREAGLDEAAMEKWHRIFESRYPQAHQSFLEWLGLDPAGIEEIRGNCK